jgi:hypothetical protein
MKLAAQHESYAQHRANDHHRPVTVTGHEMKEAAARAAAGSACDIFLLVLVLVLFLALLSTYSACYYIDESMSIKVI